MVFFWQLGRVCGNWAASVAMGGNGPVAYAARRSGAARDVGQQDNALRGIAQPNCG